MALRDLFLFASVAVLVPLIFMRPFIGALAWTLFGVMNPHRLTWGAAYDFPFALVIAAVTLIALFVTRQHRKVKGGAAGVVLVLLLVWCTLTLPFSENFEDALAYYDRVFKVFLMTGVLLLLMHTRRQVELLVWTLVIALGFYGFKGGLFVLLTGGEFMVMGPAGSAMWGNNSLAVGLVMIIPLMVFLFQMTKSKWIRWGLIGGCGLCAIAVLGSYSRGALLAILAMLGLLWLRSRYKLVILAAGFVFVLGAIPAMPERWTERMETIQNYEEDRSAMGRINAWIASYNLAKDRFPIGGGFEWESPATYRQYAPTFEKVLVAHSIYFQALGAQGFIGLFLFLLFWWLVWRQCTWIRRTARSQQMQWAYSLASMTQVSLAGYAVGGAFLDIAFWDVPYYLFAAIGATVYVVRAELHAKAGAPESSLQALRTREGSEVIARATHDLINPGYSSRPADRRYQEASD